MENAIVFNGVIKANDLDKRWPGLDDHELASYIDSAVKAFLSFSSPKDAFPSPYWLRKEKGNPKTGIMYYYCERLDQVESYGQGCMGNKILYDFTGIVFKTEDVNNWEESREWLSFVDPDNMPQSDDEWIPAESIRKLLLMPPCEFLEFLHACHVETNLEPERKEFYNARGIYAGDFFAVNELSIIKINKFSWMRYAEKNALPVECQISRPKIQHEELIAEKQRMGSFEGRLKKACQENEALKSRIADLEAQLGQGTAAATPKCAICRADSPSVSEWTSDVEAAVQLTARLVKEGERNCTVWHENEWKKTRGASRSRAFHAFRRALPDEYKDDDPRKK